MANLNRLPAALPKRRSFGEMLEALPAGQVSHAATLFASINVSLYTAMAVATWAAWGGWYRVAHAHGAAWRELLAITAIEAGYGVLIISLAAALRPWRWAAAARYAALVSVTTVLSVPRVVALMAIYSTPVGATFAVTEWMAGLISGFAAVGAGWFLADLLTIYRNQESARRAALAEASRKAQELQDEEMRVRRMVADRLHGTLQFQLVQVAAGMDALAATLPAAESAQLATLANRLEQVREEEVRSLSHAVFPAGVEVGALAAIMQMINRLPPHIKSHIDLGPNLLEFHDAATASMMPLADRLVAVYTIEEALSNAIRHGKASEIWLSAEARPLDATNNGTSSNWVLEVSIDDNGVGLVGPTTLSGLSRHAERLTARGGSLELSASIHGGAQTRFAMPFERQELNA